MPTQRQTLNNRLPTGNYALPSRAGMPLRAVVAQPTPEHKRRTDPPPVHRPQQRVPTASLALLVVAALLVCGFGIGYLSVQAQETVERNRTVKLQRLLKQELETQQRLQTLKTQRYSLENIARKARELGMVPDTDRPTMIVGEIPATLPPSSQSSPTNPSAKIPYTPNAQTKSKATQQSTGQQSTETAQMMVDTTSASGGTQ